MQSITTRYRGPTDKRGARIFAKASGGARCSIPYDYAKSSADVHDDAVRALCAKMGWTGRLARGEAGNGKGNVYVFVQDERDFFEVGP
jgi:hypothetical protein